jgi:peptide/nickel transport system substrate-binding protein
MPQAPSDEAPRASGPKRVRAAISGDPWTLSRIMNGDLGRVRGVNELELMLHAGLAVEDEKGELQALLAEAVPSLDNGLWRLLPGGRMETTWRIRESARWHDGTPFTADDLLFTTRVGMEGEVTAYRARGFDAVDGIEALDPRTVTVRWSQPYFEASTMFSAQAAFAMPLPKHLMERPYLTDKAGFAEHAYWTTEFVGTSAYRLREFARSSHMILEANPHYVLGRPKVDEVEVRFITDLNTLMANLLTGDLDIAIGRSISIEHGVQLRDRWPEGKVIVEHGSSWTALYPQHLNPTPPALVEAPMRAALLLSIDRQELVDVLLHGVAPIAETWVAPGRPEYREVEHRIVRYPYDLRRASQIVEGYGYTRGGEGFFRDATGQRFTVELRSTGGDDFRDKEVLSIADNWQRAGIGVEVVFIPRQRAQDREYRVTRPGFEMVSQGTGITDLTHIHSRAMPTPYNRHSGPNRAATRALSWTR